MSEATKLDIKSLSEDERAELMRQIQDEQTEKDNQAKRELARVITGLASEGNKAKFQDDPRFWRNGNQWTFYVFNDSPYDTYIGDLGGRGREESQSARVHAHSGLDLLSVTSDEEAIKASNDLATHLRPDGPLKRMTPDEWDARADEFREIDNWRNQTIQDRKRKSEENARVGESQRSRIYRSDDQLRRAAKPIRPKVAALADRIRQTFPTGIMESEIINRVRTFGNLNTYEHEVLLASINEMLAEKAYQFLKGITPVKPDEKAIQDEIQRLRDKALARLG